MSIRPIIAAAIAVLAATSCNNDVFVEPTAPSAYEVVLDGDGASAHIKFQPSGLQYIYFYCCPIKPVNRKNVWLGR